MKLPETLEESGGSCELEDWSGGAWLWSGAEDRQRAQGGGLEESSALLMPCTKHSPHTRSGGQSLAAPSPQGLTATGVHRVTTEQDEDLLGWHVAETDLGGPLSLTLCFSTCKLSGLKERMLHFPILNRM